MEASSFIAAGKGGSRCRSKAGWRWRRTGYPETGVAVMETLASAAIHLHHRRAPGAGCTDGTARHDPPVGRCRGVWVPCPCGNRSSNPWSCSGAEEWMNSRATAALAGAIACRDGNTRGGAGRRAGSAEHHRRHRRTGAGRPSAEYNRIRDEYHAGGAEARQSSRAGQPG